MIGHDGYEAIGRFALPEIVVGTTSSSILPAQEVYIKRYFDPLLFFVVFIRFGADPDPAQIQLKKDGYLVRLSLCCAAQQLISL